jgi:hypothetical protein
MYGGIINSLTKLHLVGYCYLSVEFNFWHRRFTFNSNKSPTWCNIFLVYYPDVCLQLNMFRAFSRTSSGAQWLQWQPLVLHSYRGESRVVFVVGPAGILYIFSINISTEYFKHAAHSPFFSSKCRLFHNATLFGFCIILIINTGCAKI